MNNTTHWLNCFKPVFYFTSLLWIIKSAEGIFSLDIRFLTILPREVTGLLGIIFAPLLHSSWNHLAANSLPLLLLGSLLAYGYPVSKWKTLLIVWLVSGFGVWLFGRPSYHLGASGLTTGLFYFLFIASILRRDRISIAIMCIAVFMYGSILLGILPWDPRISFEAHFFGAIGGILSAILFCQQDPKAKRKIYDWEQEESSNTSEEDEYWKVKHSVQDLKNNDENY